MIQIRARFQQIVQPQARIEFSVDPYNLFLPGHLAHALNRETRPLTGNENSCDLSRNLTRHWPSQTEKMTIFTKGFHFPTNLNGALNGPKPINHITLTMHLPIVSTMQI